MKTVFQFIALWFLAFLITFIFILPNTATYKDIAPKFDQVVEEKGITVPPPPQDVPYRYGFVIGYLAGDRPLFIGMLLGLQTIAVVLVLLLIKRIARSTSKNVLLPDPLESIKNVLSNLLLFTFGIFNRRASNQLQFYFDLPVRSRIIALAAYAIIFLAISLSYNIPYIPGAPQFTVIAYLQVIVIVVLLALTLFYKPFRKNYQRRLFWLSLTAFALLMIVSSSTGFNIASTQLNGANPAEFFSSVWNANTFVVNLLIIMAFSFYIEIMKQVSTQKAGFEAEMAVARRIQNELLPVLNIQHKQYSLYGKTITAHEVGGDYCDAIQLPDGRLAVAVGDVSGHNVAAGVLMSMLKIAFRTELSYLKKPEQLVASLNKTVCDHTSKNMFISFLFGLVDPAAHKMTLINCGHPPLLHYSREKESVQSHRTGDVALGLREGVSFESQMLQYSTGDLLVFFSDGLTETANAKGDELEIDVITNLIKKHSELDAERIYAALINEVNEFRGQAPQRDDVTAVVIKIK